jgi:hypothetical protein
VWIGGKRGKRSSVLLAVATTESGSATTATSSDPELLSDAWQQANRRASSKSRRYFVKNDLRYMWVLTYEEATSDRALVMAQVSEFARRLRAALGGVAIPYWYSPELHPGGHGWHVNFFLSRTVPHAQVASLWGHGFVYVTDFATARRGSHGERLTRPRSATDACRRAARYGCKYSQKDWSPQHVGPRSHRYEVAQGFSPRRRSEWLSEIGEADELLLAMLPPQAIKQLSAWDSNDTPEWTGPRVKVWKWQPRGATENV